ncbi:MAG: type 4a pilus biogenesis protein PilO [bacterium]
MANQPIKKPARPAGRPAKTRELFMRHYRLATFLPVALILGLGYFLLLGPKYQELKSGGQFDLDSKQRELRTLEQQLANLKILKQNLADLEKQDLSGLRLILPAKKDLPGLFVQLEKIASENDFVLLSIGITAAPPAKDLAAGDSGLRKLGIGLSLSGGNYADLLRLLADFEYNLRLLDVAAINFTPTPTSSGQSSYSLNLTTYYLAD